MGDDSNVSGNLEDSSSMVELTGKIMVAAIICLFFVLVFVFLLHLYAKWFWYRRPDSTRRRRRFEFVPGHQELTATSALRRGLDPSALKTIPVVEFSAKDFKDGLECAVCLCEVSEGEKARLLPKCNHGFHVECIDMWFQSHSTCPLCRNPIPNPAPAESASDESLVSSETPNFPTNVLFWGDDTQVSTLGTGLDEQPQQGPISSSAQSSCPSSSSLTANAMEGMLVIDIPRHAAEDDQEQKSPMTTRLRSLKRLLSRENRVSPRSNVDVEQGGRSQC
ncbi:hypothetical protein DM860_014324 [Cuscuta australis]|uniref:RING-type E3 ubiquitin transferase n=1 Tax=Cuscuta australis TaxID=267555 RepID=A0A328DIH9_9ASTE|nr:hypothetical protein DM860_014324 [Cuscuta australis]